MKDLGPDFKAFTEKADNLVFQEMSKVFGVLEPDELKQNFETILGGSVYLVDSETDLPAIDNLYGSSIVYRPSVFDVAAYFGPNQEYAVLVLITNNSGGNTYIIPKNIADTCPNIAESIRMTQNENQTN